MKSIQAPLFELPAFLTLNKELEKPSSCVQVDGCTGSEKLHLMDACGADFRSRILVTYSDLRAKELLEDARFYDRNVLLYPAKDLIFYQADIHGNEITRERMRCLRRLIEGGELTVITTFSALMTPQIPLSVVKKHVFSVEKEKQLELSETARKLAEMGYEKVYQVEAPGQFAIRGDILDVFDLTEENPYRIELFGDEVESLRSFDLMSQRSIEPLDQVRIYPASEMILEEDRSQRGIEKITAEAQQVVEKFRKEMKTEQAHRLDEMVKELVEQVEQQSKKANLESFIRYFYEDTVSFLEYFKTGIGAASAGTKAGAGARTAACLFIDEAGHVLEQGRAVEEEFRQSMIHRAEQGYILPGQMDLLYGTEETVAKLSVLRRVLLCEIPMPKDRNLFAPEKEISIGARSLAPYNNSFERLVHDLKQYKKEKYRVLILSGSRTRAKRLVDDLRDNGIESFYSEDPQRVPQPGEIMTYYGRILKGFEYPEIRFAVISESDIFTEHVKKKRKKKKHTGGQAISGFSDLKIGDYVIHEDHGLGIYRGIEKIVVDRVARDYMKIEYAGGGNLYVLASGFEVIQKYAAGAEQEEGKPRNLKLNKLGGTDWARTKAKVKSAVNEIAEDLVELYAKRQAEKGYAFTKDTVWQQEFEDAFPYQETEDQENAIADVKNDMESTKIMDRLVCGDVGFGKTEIAIRAAFKAVQDSKQVAVLVPTTILAQQHYNTFSSRMRDFPVRVEMLSRFRTAAEQKKTLQALKKGEVDIVIGTHRMLSKDVVFKNLGLLVVDEEQRFGVTHKEKVKKLRENIDVLTLSATPIPRTLHMSLVGIRDMSLLEEAPNDRLPIQTYVCEYNDEMVREAVVRELNRGGQVYYVYNRVSTIADIAARLKKLVPEARVAFAHGQMAEQELEKIMYDFISGDIDVLVSTTIIETGLDIPNVNTMIIHDSDQMGLAQLYQLRGRVGRSNRTAYAFLMYKRNRMLKEVAEKRLSAIREFTDLGSGYRIAMRDLEIRGAGNLLGQRQSGHMMAVGYDLYCKMLEESIRKQKRRDKIRRTEELLAGTQEGKTQAGFLMQNSGENARQTGGGTQKSGEVAQQAGAGVPKSGEVAREREEDWQQEEEETFFHTNIDLAVDAFIPPEYILNEEQKLEIYKRIAALETEAEADDMRDELIDRFGALPESVDNLIRISLLRTRAHRLFLTEVRGGGGSVTFTLTPAARIRVDAIPKLLAEVNPKKKAVRTIGPTRTRFRAQVSQGNRTPTAGSRTQERKLTFHGAGAKPCFVYAYPRRLQQAEMGDGTGDRKEVGLLDEVEGMFTRMEQILL